MHRYDKRACFERGTNLLSRDDDNVLVYAALELRECIEAVVYEKLSIYSKYVPGLVFEKWQPPHALKMLLQFEPDADENLRVRIAPESAPGVAADSWTDLGEHRTFKLGWLVSNYNRLGSYLHVPHGRDQGFDTKKMREDLVKIAAGIERVLQSSIVGMTLAERVQFKCAVCGQECLANASGLRQSKRAVCVKPNCGAVHYAKEDERGWMLHLEATEFKCRHCHVPIRLQNRFLDVGRHFLCPECQTEHVIVEWQWAYATRREAESYANEKVAPVDRACDPGAGADDRHSS